MKKAMSLFFVCSFISTSWISLGHAGQPMGVLLSCKGTVTVIKTSGEEIPGSYGTRLEAGDRVKTGPKSMAEVHFENGGWFEIGAGSSFLVKSSDDKLPQPRSRTGEQQYKKFSRFLKLKDAEGTTQLAALRSAKEKAELVLEAPAQTKVASNQPQFRWRYSDSTTQLKMTIYDEEGVFYEVVVPATGTMIYPSDAPGFKPGVNYSWTLETTDPLQVPPVRSPAAFFEILSIKEQATIKDELNQIALEQRPTQSTYHLVRASVFYAHSAVGEAIHEAMAALELDPTNETVVSILSRLHEEIGVPQEALY